MRIARALALIGRIVEGRSPSPGIISRRRWGDEGVQGMMRMRLWSSLAALSVSSISIVVRDTLGVEGFAGAARKRPLAERRRDDVALVDFRDRGQRDDFPAFLFEDMADQVVFMQPLHDDDDRSPVLFVEARVKRIVEPIVDASSAALRHRVGWLHRVVDQDEVRAASGEHAANRGRHAESAARCHKLLQGGARGDEPRREDRLIPPGTHDGSAVSGELIRELLTVGDVMIAAEGRWPNSQAGNAIDVFSDLRLRGGMLMMRRRILSSRTSCSFAATTWRCQFDRNDAPELSSAKQRLMNVWKSPRKAT